MKNLETLQFLNLPNRIEKMEDELLEFKDIIEEMNITATLICPYVIYQQIKRISV